MELPLEAAPPDANSIGAWGAPHESEAPLASGVKVTIEVPVIMIDIVAQEVQTAGLADMIDIVEARPNLASGSQGPNEYVTVASILLNLLAICENDRLAALRQLGQLELDLACLRREFLEVNESLLTVGEFLEENFHNPESELHTCELSESEMLNSSNQHLPNRKFTTIVPARTRGLAGVELPVHVTSQLKRIEIRGLESGMMLGQWTVPHECAEPLAFSLGRSLHGGDTAILLTVSFGSAVEGLHNIGKKNSDALEVRLYRWPPGMYLPREWGHPVAFHSDVTSTHESQRLEVDFGLWTAHFSSIRPSSSRSWVRPRYVVGSLDHSFVNPSPPTWLQLHPPVSGLGLCTLVPATTSRNDTFQLEAFVASAESPALKVSAHTCSDALAQLLQSGTPIRHIPELDVVIQGHNDTIDLQEEESCTRLITVDPTFDHPAILLVTSLSTPGSNAFAWLRFRSARKSDFE